MVIYVEKLYVLKYYKINTQYFLTNKLQLIEKSVPINVDVDLLTQRQSHK